MLNTPEIQSPLKFLLATPLVHVAQRTCHQFSTNPRLLAQELRDCFQSCFHSRRLVKNIVWAKKILGEKVVKSDKCMCVFQLLGARARAPPKVYAYACFYSTRFLSPIQLVFYGRSNPQIVNVN